jgi:hypothetical protein
VLTTDGAATGSPEISARGAAPFIDGAAGEVEIDELESRPRVVKPKRISVFGLGYVGAV